MFPLCPLGAAGYLSARGLAHSTLAIFCIYLADTAAHFLLFTFEFCYCALKLLVGLALAALPVWKMTVTNAMMHENNPVSANTSQEIPTR